MTLTIGYFRVKDLELGKATRLDNGKLIVNREGLVVFLLTGDERLKSVEVSVAKPGESTRIICIKDVIEPWFEVEGAEPGHGVKHVWRGMAIVTCGRIVGFQEGIIDMSGPGALYTPFAHTLNLVLDISVVDGLPPHEHEEAVRKAGLAASGYLREAARKLRPEATTVFRPPEEIPVSPQLPRVAYVYMLLSQGLLHDTYVFGRNAKEGLPRIASFTRLMDNAIVSGNCVSACDKNTTYHHQNNPLLRELYRRHGKDLNFVGVVLTNEPVRLADKRASAAQTVELIKSLDATGAIISKEGFGNPDADQMMIIRGLEQAGIKTCAITDEYPGPDGFSQSLADTTPEADAIISTGNANERIVLPPMARILGPIKDLSKLAGAYPQSLRDNGELEIELQGVIGSTNQLGAHTLTCREV